MDKRARRNHSPKFKAKVALATKNGKTIAEIAQNSVALDMRTEHGSLW